MSHILANGAGTDGRVQRLVVASVAYDPMTLDEAVTQLRDALTRGVGGRLVIVDHPRHAVVSDDATIVLSGSAAVVWASRLASPSLRGLPERVTPARLADAVCAACVTDGRRLFLVGGAPGGHGVPSGAQRGCAVLSLRHRGLAVAGCASVASADELVPLVGDIVEAKPDVVLVGTGRLLHEAIATALRPELVGTWIVGLPGAVDEIVGDVPSRRARLIARLSGRRVL